MDSKVTIGSEEWICLNELNIPHIKARIDSGAKTSSLHALNIQPYQKDGQTWVSFGIYPIQVFWQADPTSLQYNPQEY